jgi:hypothetical protein
MFLVRINVSLSCGTRRLDDSAPKVKVMGRALGFTGLQILKKELVVRHIGKEATVLYEFKKRVGIMQGS